MRHLCRIGLIALFFLGLFAVLGFADTHYAASLSKADIQTAINQAENGDTVVLPAGTNSSFGSDYVIIAKNIELKGAGKNATILIRDSVENTNPFFRWDLTQCTSVHVHGFKIQATMTSDATEKGLLLGGDFQFPTFKECLDVKVYNMAFEGFSYYAISVLSYAKGCIWNCDFINCYRPGYGYGIMTGGRHSGDGGTDGEWSWNQAMDLGGDSALYVEDCYFNGTRHSICSNARGARYVFRHNHIIGNAPNDYYCIDTHGTSGGYRGHRKVEIYENDIDLGGIGYQYQAAGITTGNGVIYNNDITGCVYPSNAAIFFRYANGADIAISGVADAGGGVIDSYTTKTLSRGLRISTTFTWVAQSFLTTAAYPISKVTIWGRRNGTTPPEGNLWVEIQPDSSGAPSGTPITNGTSVALVFSTIGTSEYDIDFTFTTNPSVDISTTYWIVIKGDWAIDGTNYLRVFVDDDAGYADGQFAKWTGAAWSTTDNDDAYFKTNKLYSIEVTTSTAHGFANGDQVSIIKTTDYDGVFNIWSVTSTTFEIEETWTQTRTGECQKYPLFDQTTSVYVWGNSFDGNPEDDYYVRSTSENQAIYVKDRDYFFTELGGYEPYTYPHPLRGTAGPILKVIRSVIIEIIRKIIK